MRQTLLSYASLTRRNLNDTRECSTFILNSRVSYHVLVLLVLFVLAYVSFFPSLNMETLKASPQAKGNVTRIQMIGPKVIYPPCTCHASGYGVNAVDAVSVHCVFTAQQMITNEAFMSQNHVLFQT